MSTYAKTTLDNQSTPSLWLFWGGIVFAILGLGFLLFMIGTNKGF